MYKYLFGTFSLIFIITLRNRLGRRGYLRFGQQEYLALDFVDTIHHNTLYGLELNILLLQWLRRGDDVNDILRYFITIRVSARYKKCIYTTYNIRPNRLNYATLSAKEK